jgi:hypothetical protein
MTPNTLIERLRGLIRVPVNDGAGLLDDKDFFERQFPASRIALEAADRIEALEADQKEEDTAFKGLLDAHRNALPRIEALEAALREIEQHPLTDGFAIREIARQALEAK